MAAKKNTKKAPRKRPPTKGAKKAPPKKAPVAKTPNGAGNGGKKKTVAKKPVPKKPAKKTGPKANAAKAPKKNTGRLPAGKTANGLATLGSKGTSKSVMTALLSLGQIVVKKGFNPRTSGVGDITSLAANIKAEGLLSALVVRPTNVASKFSLIAGERRLRAMQKAGYKGEIPVIIRADLVDDDARAQAVALAENSEDGRSNLNPIEIGRVVTRLAEDEKWQTSRIAKETGLDHKKVQRCLKLMTIDVSVRKKVEAGDIGMIAGLEFASLDEKTRKAVADEITSGTTAADVRRLRKNAENQASSEAAAEAAETGKGKDGKKAKPKVTPTAWRGSREKQALLREVSYDLVQMQADKTDPMDYDFIESRALAVALLWDRGDLDTVEVPPEGTDVAKEKKALVVLWKKIDGAAALYEPPEEEEVEVEEAGEPEEASVA